MFFWKEQLQKIPHVCSTVKQLNCMQVVKSQSTHVGAILSLVLPCKHAAYNSHPCIYSFKKVGFALAYKTLIQMYC